MCVHTFSREGSAVSLSQTRVKRDVCAPLNAAVIPFMKQRLRAQGCGRGGPGGPQARALDGEYVIQRLGGPAGQDGESDSKRAPRGPLSLIWFRNNTTLTSTELCFSV